MIGEKLFNHNPNQTVLPSCELCGCLVGDADKHTAWHASHGLYEKDVPALAAATDAAQQPPDAVDPTDALISDPDVPNIVPIDV